MIACLNCIKKTRKKWVGYEQARRQGLSIDTGKSMSEALIFASTNPQSDNRLFIKLPASSVKVKICVNCLNFLQFTDSK